ncbi:hypothetical protein VIGAN_07141800 [Vigna angularis var. angularis]|uniref:Uncharacterized protein n=1 Tax=Vigna angularis var. angularis TaxID=157739 RepID=A0A0S3SIG1_PHAAN|nr:hypothetical protein VIGAN_07141800 [Vigna angularis var. angularis]
MFSNEDVTIGAWMLAMNVNHENSRELCAQSVPPHQLLCGIFPSVQVSAIQKRECWNSISKKVVLRVQLWTLMNSFCGNS